MKKELSNFKHFREIGTMIANTQNNKKNDQKTGQSKKKKKKKSPNNHDYLTFHYK